MRLPCLRLPNEPEWEKAARGGLQIPKQALIRPAQEGLGPGAAAILLQANPLPERIYPWGDAVKAERANTAESGIGATSTPGCFPSGVSPYGALDMIGDVWEWTRSLWGEDLWEPSYGYPYQAGDGREDPGASDGVARIIRGGSYGNTPSLARCALRDWYLPLNRYDYFGFRCVCSPL